MKSQIERVKDWIEHYGHIDDDTAKEYLGIKQVARRIYDLKRDPFNMDIQTETVPVKDRFGHTCHVARYKLVKEGQPELML